MLRNPLRSRPLTRARSAASLGLVAVLAAPLIGSATSVSVAVDGETLPVRSYAATVGDLLEDEDIEVDPSDRVVPSRSTELRDGLSVRVQRAIDVEITVDDGPTRTVTAPVSTVSGALDTVGLGSAAGQGAAIDPAPRTTVDDGDAIEVTFPKRFAIDVDGKTHEGETLAETVGELLDDQDIEIGDRDRVVPRRGSDIDGPVEVDVDRIAFKRVTKKVTLARETKERATDDLLEGKTRLVREGRDGLKRVVFRVRTVDGERTERRRVKAEVVRKPRARIVEVGTKPRPEPKPAPEPEPTISNGSAWARLAQCESGGNWSLNTGNGYYGGLQFSLDTWRNVGGSGYPHQHSRAEQIRRGEILRSQQGWSAWPHCSREAGLR